MRGPSSCISSGLQAISARGPPAVARASGA